MRRYFLSLILFATAWAGSALAEKERIDSDFSFSPRYEQVFGHRMHYVESGEGRPILLLHGQPTWSYLWRNIIPELEEHGRVIALDLIGFGKSDQPDISYTVEDHQRYVDEFIRQKGLKDVTIVVHDWGTFMGLHYAATNSENVAGIVMMEALLRPDLDILRTVVPDPDDPRMKGRETIMQIREPEVGERLINEENVFIEELMPQGVLAGALSDTIHEAYRAPFEAVRSRLPMLQFPRLIVGRDGEPAYVREGFGRIYGYLQTTNTPTLLLTFRPGALVRGPQIAWAKQNISNLTVSYVGEGLHYVQEEEPEAIGEAIVAWMEDQKE